MYCVNRNYKYVLRFDLASSLQSYLSTTRTVIGYLFRLDTAQYEVEFEDGAVERYHANIIAEHIYSQMDDEGNGVALLDDIIDHKREETECRGLGASRRVSKHKSCLISYF